MSFTPQNALGKANSNLQGTEFFLGAKRALGEKFTKADVFILLIARIKEILSFKDGRDEKWLGMLKDAINQNMTSALKEYLSNQIEYLRTSNPDYEILILTPALVSLSFSSNLDPYLLLGLEEFYKTL